MPILSNLDAFFHAARAGAAGGHVAEGGEKPSLLALDLSKKAIGIAGSDPGWQLVTPLGTIRRRGLAKDLAAIGKRLEERRAGGLIIGLPLNMDGSEGPRCQAVRQFAKDADRAFALPILLFDERLTTFEAGERAEAMGLSGKQRADMLDALAACLILEDALGALRRADG